MPKIKPAPPAPANQILARLPAKDYQRLLPHLEPVELPLRKVVYQPGSLTEYAYFPTRGVISMVALMEDGRLVANLPVAEFPHSQEPLVKTYVAAFSGAELR